MSCNRRHFLSTSLAASAGMTLGGWHLAGQADASPGAESASPESHRSILPDGVEVRFPRDRVPLTFIIDDSTCLVNMGHFCMPQFAQAWPDREVYKRQWKLWPREIPDTFVRQFGEWCADHGVKGKYSVVPYPACVGWLDRELPGWSRLELLSSLKLVRELLVPNWDIHPEMITHTRVIDLKTGRPMEEISAATMENSYPREHKSVDELTEYLAYALQILKNCELPCQGITTPGGFGNLVKNELSQAVQESVRDVYQSEIPHYFKYVISGDKSTEPTLEHVDTSNPEDVRLTVNIPAGTGDWFGGWEGDRPSEGFRYANDDATSGRMVELIERNQPAFMLCHWPGIYSNGTLEGFRDFQNVVLNLHRRFADRIHWMKLSEIARYWATKGTVGVESNGTGYVIRSYFDCPEFTLALPCPGDRVPMISHEGEPVALEEVDKQPLIRAGHWWRGGEQVILCWDLPKGESNVAIS